MEVAAGRATAVEAVAAVAAVLVVVAAVAEKAVLEDRQRTAGRGAGFGS